MESPPTPPSSGHQSLGKMYPNSCQSDLRCVSRLFIFFTLHWLEIVSTWCLDLLKQNVCVFFLFEWLQKINTRHGICYWSSFFCYFISQWWSVWQATDDGHSSCLLGLCKGLIQTLLSYFFFPYSNSRRGSSGAPGERHRMQRSKSISADLPSFIILSFILAFNATYCFIVNY